MSTFIKSFLVTGLVLVMLMALIGFSVESAKYVERAGERQAGVVCGTMYFAEDTATEEDFKALLELSEAECEDPPGTETSFRNKDKSLKHAIAIGDANTIRTPGTEFDTCIVNWELSPKTALRAFKEVCIDRRF